MAVTIKGTIYDGVRGAKIEFGTFTVSHATIAAQIGAEATTTLDGLASGDLVFCNPRQLTAGLNYRGARVTAADTIGVAVRNDSTQSVAISTVTYEYIAIKFGGDA